MTRTVMLVAIAPGLMVSGTVQPITVMQSYLATLTASGGAGGYKFSEAGLLPSGLSFTDNGNGTSTLSGTVPAGNGGIYPISVFVSDLGRNFRTVSYNLIVNEIPLSLSGHAPNASAGSPYSYSYTIAGGVSPYTCYLGAGSLPAGLSLSAAGTISGTPTSGGDYSFVVIATDSKGKSISVTDGMNSTRIPLSVSGTYTSPVIVGNPYSSSLTISGGGGMYSNARAITGSLPSGLLLSISGNNLTLSGIPTVAVSSSFTVAVDSGDGQTANSPQTVTVTVDSTALSIYNKIANSAGGSGLYFDLHESSGSRADTANSSFSLSVSRGSNSTANGPRGAGDIAFDCGSRANSLSLATAHANAVPASEFCIFGWAYSNSDPPDNDGNGFVAYSTNVSNPSNVGYYLQQYKASGQPFSYVGCGDSTDTVQNNATQNSFPTTGAWHFYVGWRDSSDNHVRFQIDGGTVYVSSGTGSPSSSISGASFNVGAYNSGISQYPWNGRVSRVGYIKGAFLTSTEITWLINSGQGRDWSEIKMFAGH